MAISKERHLELLRLLQSESKDPETRKWRQDLTYDEKVRVTILEALFLN